VKKYKKNMTVLEATQGHGKLFNNEGKAEMYDEPGQHKFFYSRIRCFLRQLSFNENSKLQKKN
jgi:hypothetical protein